MKVAVFGVGYVGSVTGALMAEAGHEVVMLDVSQTKLDAIAAGEPPVEEPGLREIMRSVVSAGRIRVSRDVAGAVRDTDVGIVCVGTPSAEHGGIDLSHVERICTEIGTALRARSGRYVVTIRSTVLPGTMRGLVIPTLDRCSGKQAGVGFAVAFNPEFLRESSAIKDYKSPPKIVIGTDNTKAEQALRELYRGIEAPLIVVAPEVAELVKYADNAWHALKIVFGNEIGEICRISGVDSHAVMDIFLLDRQLNISPVYLKPGFAFGGSCLPKDLRAILHYARHRDVQLPMLESVTRSNDALIEDVSRRILRSGARTIGFYGISFKPNTDDLRESPFVLLAEKLIGKGIRVKVYDENVQFHRLTGANREYLLNRLPHFVELLVDSFDALQESADMIVICHATDAARQWIERRIPGVKVFELARLTNPPPEQDWQGVSW